MKANPKSSQICCFLLTLLFVFPTSQATGAENYIQGDFRNYAHATGEIPEGDYQYSVHVPKNYDPGKSYPVVFHLHGGQGRKYPTMAKRNMVSMTIADNKFATDAGYTTHDKDYIGYILVSPVKPVLRWNANVFKSLLAHVASKVSVNENRVYVLGVSMGGQGTWRFGHGNDGSYKIAAMLPFGAWGCNEVKRGETSQASMTLKTPVWVSHCPLDPVSKIKEQLVLFSTHLETGGYGRFTMIPGKGHIMRSANDTASFNFRMGWMLSQEYGTPFNRVLQTKGGTIVEVTSGARSYTGSNNAYGFYEAGTVVNITAPAMKDGKPFVKWASMAGSFGDASSRSTTFATVEADVILSAIYDTSGNLTITGGTANPAVPLPGQIVTVTVDGDVAKSKFIYWTTNTGAADIANPIARSFQFVMPSGDVALSAKPIIDIKRRRK